MRDRFISLKLNKFTIPLKKSISLHSYQPSMSLLSFFLAGCLLSVTQHISSCSDSYLYLEKKTFEHIFPPLEPVVSIFNYFIIQKNQFMVPTSME